MSEGFKDWIQNHSFTATDLENYRLCPYRFYASAYLGLKPANPLEVELTPPEVGLVVHRVLERFLRDETSAKGRLSPMQILEEEMSRLTDERPALSQPLLSFQRKKIERMLESFVQGLERERTQASSWRPRYFEWSFGGNSPPLILKDADGRTASFRGRIDRIDVNEAQKMFLVIEYKTGSSKVSGNQIKSGEALQLPIYLMAVKALLLQDYEPAGAVYHQLSDMSKRDGLLHAERLPEFLEVGPRSSSLIPASKWGSVLEIIAAKIGEVVSQIRETPEEGFVSRSEPCEPFCPYQDICRLRSG